MKISTPRYANKLITLHHLIIITLLLVFSLELTAESSISQKKVAITQITSHESLDNVYHGVIDGLKRGGVSEKSISFANAQGDIGTAIQIANRFANEHVDILIPIATASAQACMKVVKNQKIPMVFASISDPVAAKLVKSLKNPGGLVTGTRNYSPIDKQLRLLKEILPAVKTIVGVTRLTWMLN